MKSKIGMGLLALGISLGIATVSVRNAYSAEGRNSAKYNLLEGSIGLKGYDPVAVFPEGGGAPKVGLETLSYEIGGVVYRFSSEANRSAFILNPDRYEPTYGGWCAYAMASGSQVDIQPTQVTIHGNRAHYFVNSRAKRAFDGDVEGYESRADRFWTEISGENPRK